MAEPGQGYPRPDDSSCYNCGARGHWAVACPEPTRQTPAGLANALRRSSNTPQGNGQHPQRGPKRSKQAPVITKYGHPPPPPHSSIGHGAPPYPPPAGLAYQQPSPQFQNSYPHHPPPIHYSAGYGPPSYPPPQYPPSSFGAPPAAPVGYTAHPPGPPPPAPAPAPYPPPSFASYPPHVGPAGSPSFPPPAAYPPSYPQPSYGPPPVHYPSRGAPAHHPPSAAAPPKPPRSSHPPSSLKEPTNSSLPPKPPKSIHTQQEPQREHRNKRKHDRQNNKHRDNRRKDQGGRRRQKMQNKANHAGSAAGPSQKAPTPANTNGSKDAISASAPGLGKNARSGSEASTNTAEMPPSISIEKSHQDDDQSPQSHARELYEDSLAADEHFENHSGDESDNTAQGLVTKPGAVSTGDHEFLSQNPQDSGYDNISTSSSHQSNEPRLNGKHRRLDDDSGDEQRPKKTKSSNSLIDGQNGAKEGSRQETHDHAGQAQGDDSPPQRDEEDDQTLPTLESRSRSRSRSRERYQKRGSKSRNSSVSSRSSDLNSLEAELLGRSDKRSSAEPSPRQRRESLTIPKMQRRRQRNADSAYSRRW
ncbi:hypothetical protein ACQKWADRAFT_286924 [Trichoderma austrokoningii]